MNKQESLDFVENNRSALIALSEIILEADTVREGNYKRYNPEVRELAIELVERWIKGVFAFAEDIELPQADRTNLYIRLDEERYSQNDGATP